MRDPGFGTQEEVVAGLSQNSVALTVNFVGSDILIFGAVRRDGAIPDGPLDVIVTVEGPPQEATIWRKARRAGIWMNTESQEVRAAPSFYAVASTAPLAEILSPEADLDYRISTRLAIFEARSSVEVSDPAAFTEALIRIRQNEGLYQEGQSRWRWSVTPCSRHESPCPRTLSKAATPRVSSCCATAR